MPLVVAERAFDYGFKVALLNRPILSDRGAV